MRQNDVGYANYIAKMMVDNIRSLSTTSDSMDGMEERAIRNRIKKSELNKLVSNYFETEGVGKNTTFEGQLGDLTAGLIESIYRVNVAQSKRSNRKGPQLSEPMINSIASNVNSVSVINGKLSLEDVKLNLIESNTDSNGYFNNRFESFDINMGFVHEYLIQDQPNGSVSSSFVDLTEVNNQILSSSSEALTNSKDMYLNDIIKYKSRIESIENAANGKDNTVFEMFAQEAESKSNSNLLKLNKEKSTLELGVKNKAEKLRQKRKSVAIQGSMIEDTSVFGNVDESQIASAKKRLELQTIEMEDDLNIDASSLEALKDRISELQEKRVYSGKEYQSEVTFEEYLTTTHEKLTKKLETINGKLTSNGYLTATEEQRIIEETRDKVLSNLSIGDVDFLEFDKKEELDALISEVDNESAQKVLENIYQPDGETYKKKFMLWDSSEDHNFGGVSDINNPNFIDQYVSTSDSADNYVDDFFGLNNKETVYGGTAVSRPEMNQIRSEVIQTKKVMDETTQRLSKQSRESKINTIKHLDTIESMSQDSGIASAISKSNAEKATEEASKSLMKNLVPERVESSIGHESLLALKQQGFGLKEVSLPKDPTVGATDFHYIDEMKKVYERVGKIELNDMDIDFQKVSGNASAMRLVTGLQDDIKAGTLTVEAAKDKLKVMSEDKVLGISKLIYTSALDVDSISSEDDMVGALDNIVDGIINRSESFNTDLSIKLGALSKSVPLPADIQMIMDIQEFQFDEAVHLKQRSSSSDAINRGGSGSSFKNDDPESAKSIFDETHGNTDILIENEKLYKLQKDTLDKNTDRISNIVKKPELNAMAAYSDATTKTIEIEDLKRPITKEELISGKVLHRSKDGSTTPVGNFSEAHQLMSVRSLDPTRSVAKPFSDDEWVLGKVLLENEAGESVGMDIRQFVETYNTNVRDEQSLGQVALEKAAEIKALRKHEAEVLQSLRDEITNRTEILEYNSRKKDGEVKVGIEVPYYRKDNPESKYGRISKKEIMRVAGDDYRINPNTITLDNVDDVLKEYGSLGLGTEMEKKLKGVKVAKDLYEEKYSSASIPELVNSKSKFKPQEINKLEEYMTEEIMAGSGVKRMRIVDREINPITKDMVNYAKENSDNKTISFTGDRQAYEVLDVGDKYVSFKPTDTVDVSTLKFQFDVSEGIDLQEAIEKSAKEQTRRDRVLKVNELRNELFLDSDDTLRVFDEAYSKKDVYAGILNNYKTVDGSHVTTNKVATDIATTHFPWMLSDIDGESFSAMSEISLLDAINTLSDNDVAKFATPGMTIDQIKETIEDAVVEKTRANLLHNFFEETNVVNNGGLPRLVSKILLSDGEEVNVENAMNVINTLEPYVKIKPELQGYFKDITGKTYQEKANFIKDRLSTAQSDDISFDALPSLEGVLNEDQIDPLRSMNLSNITSSDDIDRIVDTLSKDPDSSDSFNLIEELFLDKRVESLNGYGEIDLNDIVLDAVAFDATSKTMEIPEHIQDEVSDDWLDIIDVDSPYRDDTDIELVADKFRKKLKRVKGKLKDSDDFKEIMSDPASIDGMSELIEDYIIRTDSKAGGKMLAEFYKDGEEFSVSKAYKKLDIARLRVKAEHPTMSPDDFRDLYQRFPEEVADIVKNEGGITKIVDQKDIIKEFNSLKVNSLDDFNDIMTLFDTTEGINNIKMQGTTASGDNVIFGLEDIRDLQSGKIGQVGTDRNTKSVFTLSDRDSNLVSKRPLATMSPKEMTIKTKSNISSVADSNVFKNNTINDTATGSLSVANGEGLNLYANTNFGFDAASSVGVNNHTRSNVFSSIESLDKLSTKADVEGSARAVTIDFETTGLPELFDKEGKGHLFQPVEVAMQELKVTKQNGELKFEPQGTKSAFIGPTKEVLTYAGKLGDSGSIESMAGDMNGIDVHLLKNYAKYKNPDAAGNIDVVGGEVFVTKEYLGEDGKLKMGKFKSDKSPKEYVQQLHDDAFDVMNFLIAPEHHNGEGISINKDDVVGSVGEFVDFTRNNLEGATPIAHNLYNAEVEFNKRFIESSKVDGSTGIHLDEIKEDLTSMSSEGFNEMQRSALENKYKIPHNTEDLSTSLKSRAQKIEERASAPFLENGIDTLHLLKVGSPGNDGFSLSSTLHMQDVNGDIGTAHLADTDVSRTTRIMENTANSQAVKDAVEQYNNPMEIGDYFMKTSEDRSGLKLEKGMYRIDGMYRNNSGTVSMELTNFALKDNELIESGSSEVVANSMAIFQRDAAKTWNKYSGDQVDEVTDAMRNHNATEASRTTRRAMTDYNTLELYRNRNDGSAMVETVQSMSDDLDQVVKDISVSNQPGELGGTVLGDKEKFLYKNRSKLSGDGYEKEVSKYKRPTSANVETQHDMSMQFFDSKEGEMIEGHLKTLEDMTNAGIIDQKSKRSISKTFIDEYTDFKSAYAQDNAVPGVMVNVANNYTLGEVTGDILGALDAGTTVDIAKQTGATKSYDLSAMKPFSANLNMNSHDSVESSITGMTANIANHLVVTDQVVDKSKAYEVAMNRYVTPLLQSKGVVPSDGDWSTAVGGLRQKTMTPDVDIDVPVNLTNMKRAVASEIMLNKDELIKKEALRPLQVVDINKPIDDQNYLDHVSGLFEEKIMGAKDEYASFGGEVNPTLRGIADSYTEIAKVNREAFVESTGGQYVPYMDYSMDSNLSSNALEAKAKMIGDGTLKDMSEFNYVRPVNERLGKMNAREIKAEADALLVDRELMQPYEFIKSMKNTDPELIETVKSTHPEYVDYFDQKYDGVGGVDYISRLNNEEFSKASKEAYYDVKQPFDQKRNNLISQKSDNYRELERRANLDGGAYSSEMGMENTIREAKKELGLVQNIIDHTGRPQEVTGAIGGPGELQEILSYNKDIKGMVDQGMEPGEIGDKLGISNLLDIETAYKEPKLDPNKVIMASSPGIGEDIRRGEFLGHPVTSATTSELESIAGSSYTTKASKNLLSEYLENKDLASTHTDDLARDIFTKTKATNIAAQLSVNEVPNVDVAEVIMDAIKTEQPDYISGINEGVKQKAKEAVAGNIIDNRPNPADSMFNGYSDKLNQASKSINNAAVNMRSAVDDVNSTVKSSVESLIKSPMAKYAAGAIAFAGALALTKQITSDNKRKTPESRPQGDKAPAVDGTYDEEYNGEKHPQITPNSVRVEEKGTGLNVRVRARNNGNLNDEQVNNAVRESIFTDVRIHQTDDRSTINRDYVENLVSNMLR